MPAPGSVCVVTFRPDMLKVECEACKAPYQVDERRVPAAGLKMRCPKCGHSFVVHNPGAAAPAEAKPPPAAPPRGQTVLGVGEGVTPPIKPAVPPPVKPVALPKTGTLLGIPSVG